MFHQGRLPGRAHVPEARPRIYAYSIDDEGHKCLLKVGQTTRDVKRRVAEQLKTAAIKNYRIELDESAERDDGTLFSDHEIRAALVRKGFENVELEWMCCSVNPFGRWASDGTAVLWSTMNDGRQAFHCTV